MKYINEFRDAEVARELSSKIHNEVKGGRTYRLMEFCGGHTHAIHRYGIPSLLPKHIELIHGPGCPVCVLPISKVDHAIMLSQQKDVIFCSYGDMLRIPGTRQDSLLKSKARGADVRIIYSVDDALSLAQHNPNKHVIFFAIGFETTTPPTAYAIHKASELQLNNFSVFCNHVLTPIAMQAILSSSPGYETVPLDGFVGPAHVSIIIGSDAYKSVCDQYQKPIVISGFEPLDIMYSILMLIRQINEGRCTVENQYTRAVNPDGNLMAKELMMKIFQVRSSFEWRGLGEIPHSGLKISENYQWYDAEYRFPLSINQGQEHKACDCGDILRGIKKPTDCKVFANVCTPENPLGACMVSAEGACAAVYAYARFNK